MTERAAGNHSSNGRGKNNFRKPGSNLTGGIRKKILIDNYYFYIGSSKQALDYEMTVDFFINHIKMTYNKGNNFAKSLRKLQL